MKFPNKQDNVAEYLLFLWQIEDLLRAFSMDIDKIDKQLIEPTSISEEDKKASRDWYEGLIMMMKSEQLQEKGHLQITKNLLSELTDVHLRLLNNPKESEYIASYDKTLPHIVALRAKNEDKSISELETVFTAMYGYMLLKMQKKEISNETSQAVQQMTNMLRLLSEKYKTIDQSDNPE